jgi:hypothetical protein
MGEKRNACRLSLGKTYAKRPLGRPRQRWVDDVKTNLGEIGWGGCCGLDWTGSG